MDHITQISRRMSKSSFERTRDKMRSKSGLPVSSPSTGSGSGSKKLISDMVTNNSSLKQSGSGNNVCMSGSSGSSGATNSSVPMVGSGLPSMEHHSLPSTTTTSPRSSSKVANSGNDKTALQCRQS